MCVLRRLRVLQHDCTEHGGLTHRQLTQWAIEITEQDCVSVGQRQKLYRVEAARL